MGGLRLDLSTRQFTQEDPIGLAGGASLYGFAAGDPVNFDDPFGLCWNTQDGCYQALANWGAKTGRSWAVNLGATLEAGAAVIQAVQGSSGCDGGFVCGSAPGVGRGRMGMRPDPRAAGPHSTYRSSNGRVTNYETWSPQTNPRDPRPWESQIRVDKEGAPHFNKVTKEVVKTPHAHDKTAPGGVRPANPNEVRQP